MAGNASFAALGLQLGFVIFWRQRKLFAQSGLTFGVLLASFWRPFGVLLALLLDSFWPPFGVLLASLWRPFGVLWPPFGVLFGVLGAVVGAIVGSIHLSLAGPGRPSLSRSRCLLDALLCLHCLFLSLPPSPSLSLRPVAAARL